MELYEQILSDAIAREMASKIQDSSGKLLELKCYQAICKIYGILSDETLDDPECFMKIEEIVCVLDELGVGGGGRHDFMKAAEKSAAFCCTKGPSRMSGRAGSYLVERTRQQ